MGLRDSRLTACCLCVAAAIAAPGQGVQVSIDLDLAQGIAVPVDGAVAASGAMLVLGTVEGAPPDAFNLLRTDAEGMPQWAVGIGPTGAGFTLMPRRLVPAAGGFHHAFGTYTDANALHYFVSRIDSMGGVAWTRTYRPVDPGTDYGFSSLAGTSDGQLVLTMGFIDRTVALRLDTTGAVLWANEYLTSNSPTNKNPGFDMAATADGGVLLTQKAEGDIFLVRLLADGGVLWANRFTGGGYCQPHVALLLANGDFLLAGSSDAVPFAARVDAQGTMLWRRSYTVDEGTLERFDSAVELEDGSILLGPSAGSSGILAVHIQAGGQVIGAHGLPGGGTCRIIGRGAGRLALVGRTPQFLDGEWALRTVLLAGSDADALGCLQAPVGAGSTSLSVPPPLAGCSVVAREVVTEPLNTVVEALPAASRELCASSAPDAAAPDDHPTWHTTVIQAGEALRPVLPSRDAIILHLDAAGRTLPLRMVNGAVNTWQWAPGLHLLLVRATDGGHRATMPVLVVR